MVAQMQRFSRKKSKINQLINYFCFSNNKKRLLSTFSIQFLEKKFVSAALYCFKLFMHNTHKAYFNFFWHCKDNECAFIIRSHGNPTKSHFFQFMYQVFGSISWQLVQLEAWFEVSLLIQSLFCAMRRRRSRNSVGCIAPVASRREGALLTSR